MSGSPHRLSLSSRGSAGRGARPPVLSVGFGWGRGGLDVAALREGWGGSWGQCQNEVGNWSLRCPSACPRGPLERSLTNDADADGSALLGPVAGMGGHTAVGSLVLRPYLREQQHGAGGKGQGCALGGGGGAGRRPLTTSSGTLVFLSSSPAPYLHGPLALLAASDVTHHLPAPVPGHSHPWSSGFGAGAGQRFHRSRSQSHQEVQLHLLALPPTGLPPGAQALEVGRA